MSPLRPPLLSGPVRPLLTRRAFLALGLLAGCSCFFPATLLGSSSGGLARGRQGPRTPTDSQAARMRADFAALCQGAQALLAPRVGGQRAEALGREAQARFAALIPAIPEIGPGNRNSESLLEAVWLTALTQAMTGAGLTHRDAGRVFYDLCALEMARRPEAELKAKGKAMFNMAGRAGLAAWARRTQARKYPGDWVATAVFPEAPGAEGVAPGVAGGGAPGAAGGVTGGADFDLGYDYSQCGAVLFFRAHGVEKVAPYFCLNDFTLSRAQGTGLTRRHTIGQGDALCDFRYKLGGPVTQSWETEEPRFRKG